MSGRQSVGVRKQVELTRATWKRQGLLRAKLIAARAKVTRLRRRSRRRHEAVVQPASPWTSYERLEDLNRTLSFTPLCEADRLRLEKEAHDHTNDTVLDRKVCVVTDTWVFPTVAEHVDIEQLPFRAMQAVLSGEPWRTQAIADYYDCADIDSRLHGLLLSRRAFGRDTEGHMRVWISQYALKDLQVIESRLSRLVDPPEVYKPPRFAIADGFVAGAFEAIDQANCIERQSIGLAQIRGVVKVVYGGPGNVLNSHLLCWDNRSATIASRVPSVITRDNFQLIIAGPMTSSQELLLSKRHACNGVRVKQVQDLLRRINPLYAAIQVDIGLECRDTDSSAITTRLDSESSTDQLVVDARARQDSVAHVPERDSDVARCECTIVESETVLMETTLDRSEQDRLARAVQNVSNRTYVVHRSTSLLQPADPFYMERLFPHLLTFGYGGFSTERHHRYSARAIVLHYLNVSTNRIAEDPLFKLVMFDYLSTKRVKSGVFLRVGQDPSLAATAMRVTPSQLKVAMSNRTNQRNAWKLGRTFVPAVEAPCATALLKSINASTSKMWGSNEEREAMARKVDAVTIRYGAPSIFWTLTPNPDCSMTCAFWTGRPLPNGRPSKLADCGERNMPCSSDMAKMVMANTFVQAQYYKTCSHVLIDVLFGWDTTSNKPKAQRGIFGHVEAFVYALEQQGRLFIHHHGVAWVAGLPKTQSDWDRLLASAELKERFQRYCDSIFAAELPVYKSIGNLFCPKDGCEGSLTPTRLPKKFKHILKSFVPPPQVAKCDCCDANFTEADIISSVIETQWKGLDEDHKAVSSEQAIECIRHKFGGLSSDTATSNVQLSRLLLKDQVHAWAHTYSCVKGRNNTKCRYNFFRELVDQTHFTSNDEIVYQRRLGNQWLNSYIPLWRRIFHFNMDARILWSGHCLQATRYALQYTMKRQTVLDNVAVVELAFKKRIDREISLDTTMYAQGVGRLMSLAYATSGVMEIGGPLATAILVEGEAVTFSCLFERLIVLEGLNLLDDVVVQATVVTRNHEMYTETSIAKYIQRPRCLESWCWYDFCSWFQRSGSQTSARADACQFKSSDQSELREHLKQHNYRYLFYPRVPEIIGPRLPDSSRLQNEDYADQTELYYRMAALLYHPFRRVQDFLNDNNSAEDHFVKWNPLACATTARALERHQQHYICLKSAQEYRERMRETSEDSSDDESISLDDDILFDAVHHSDARSATDYFSIPAEMYNADLDVDMELEEGTQQGDDEDLTPIQLILHRSITTSALPPDDTRVFVASPNTITRKEVTRFLACDHSDPEEPSISAAETTIGHTTVMIKFFEHAIRDVSYNATNPVPVQLNAYSSINDISAFFTLNARQHAAFALIAVPLLAKITNVEVPTANAQLFDSKPLIITGAGGSGKSQIIEAIRALCSSWKRPTAFAVVASTGIAAASQRGSTMHSSVGLGINLSHLPKHIESPTDALLQQWAPVLCVVADEVSMTDLAFFSLWEEALRHAKDNLDRPYGGLLIVLMFDHCQLKTVRGMPLFKSANGMSSLTPTQERGRRLYRDITKVIYLTQNMRFIQDPEWGDWLQSGRLGNWKPPLRMFINGLPTIDPHQAIPHQGIIQTISTDNATRASINTAAIRIAVRCLRNDRKVYVIAARLSRRPSPTEMETIRQLPDNKTGNIPVFLQLYIGMPVRVKANQCIAKGVANGASGVVHHVDWFPDTTFTLQQDGAWLVSNQPMNLYVAISNCPSSLRFPGLPSHWPASVMPIYQATASITIPGPRLSIKGYPIVPAFGTTVHGVQGETRDAVVITQLRPPRVRQVDSHALYVALSRIRTRRGLYWIGTRPTDGDYDFFRPSSEVLLEDERLKHLSTSTLTAFSGLEVGI